MTNIQIKLISPKGFTNSLETLTIINVLRIRGNVYETTD